jgi:hypothetical protein
MRQNRNAGPIKQIADGGQIGATRAGEPHKRQRRNEQRQRQVIPDFVFY